MFGTGTLVLNGTMRRYTVSKLGLKKTEDLKDSPGKRQSLLEFAGLLTEGTLKFLQPVFVKQDKIVDSECNVYDLKCTDNGGSYFRVWFDERTHLSLRREWFGSDGKKKATFRYIGAHEIKPGVWLPEKCEILNGDDMISAVLEYRDMKANEGVPDDKFTIAGQ